MKIKEIYKNTVQSFNNGGIEAFEEEARFLISEVLNLNLTDLYLKADEQISSESVDVIEEYTKRRLKGEPLQYILGKWDFMGETYRVGKGVLIPRPETEILCEKIISILKNKKNAVVYDLCAGSGCIGISIKKYCPDAEVFLVEKSDDALGYLLPNADRILSDGSYTAIKGDVLNFELFENYPKADLIVSNPPYIKSAEVPLLQKEVTFEPKMALDGGDDGLDFYRYIVSEWSKKLKSDGEMYFEIGEDQGEAVSRLFDSIGFDSEVIKDYNNLDRIVKGRKRPYDI